MAPYIFTLVSKDTMKNKYPIALIVGFLVGVVPLGLYFYRFNSELSFKHNVWGEFGSLYGGVLGPCFAFLAFIGLLWNLDITKRQFRRESENNTFFNLISLHNNKVQMIEFEESEGINTVGFGAFKKYSEEFSRLYDEDSILVARRELSTNTRNLTDNGRDFLWRKYAKQFHENVEFWRASEADLERMVSLFEKSSDYWELQKGLIGTDDSISPEDRESLISIGHVTIEDSPPEKRIEIIKRVNEFFYHEYGHMLGHYFRNIHYILKIIDTTEKSIEYSKLFRAQLSRYELAMIYYNLINKNTSEEFIRLVIKYDLFNEVYRFDICYFPDANKQSLDIYCILQQKLTKP